MATGAPSLVNRLLRARNRMIGACLLGNTLVNIGVVGLHDQHSRRHRRRNGAIYATVLMTVLVLVFAEVMPKTVAINHPDRMSLLVARTLSRSSSRSSARCSSPSRLSCAACCKLVGVDASQRRSILSRP